MLSQKKNNPAFVFYPQGTQLNKCSEKKIIMVNVKCGCHTLDLHMDTENSPVFISPFCPLLCKAEATKGEKKIASNCQHCHLTATERKLKDPNIQIFPVFP